MLEQLPDAVGHALRNTRAGLDHIASHKIGLRAGLAAIDVRSLAFADHGPIPERYTADGEGVSPPLHWTGLPAGTQSVALIVEDADSPTPAPLVHAIVVDLVPSEAALAEGALDSPDHVGAGLRTGQNSFLRARWLPPDPPPGHGVHRYAFQVFALRASPAFSGTFGRDALLSALGEHAIASGCLIGTYERPDGSVKEGASDTIGTPLVGTPLVGTPLAGTPVAGKAAPV